MKIAFPCENCGHRFEVDGSLAGKKCKCKQCGHVFMVPVPRQPSQPTPKPVKTFGSQAAPAAKPSRPAAKPTFDPYYDDDDPYSTDPTSVSQPSRNNPSAYDDEEFLPPHAPKPLPVRAGAASGTKKKRRSDASALDEAPWWVAKIGGALTLASAFVCLFSTQFGMALVGTFYFLTALTMLGIGSIGMLVVPFLESAVAGLMNLFVPFYSLYYLLTRWEEMKRWFLTYLVGGLLFLPGLFVAVGLPAAQIVRDAAHAAQLKAEIDAAGPNDPGRAEKEAELARIKARLDGQHNFAEAPKPFEAPSSAPEPAPFVPAAPQDQPFESPEYRASRAAPSSGFDIAPGPPPASGFGDAPAAIPAAGIDRVAPPTSMPTDPNLVTSAMSDLKAADPGRRKAALERLKAAPTAPARKAEVAKAVEPLLLDADRGCRAEAARALASWGGRENSPALVKVLNDKDIDVREAALDALAAVKDPSSADAIAARLTDTRDRAARALKAIGRPAEAATMKYLTHDDIWVRTEACKVLEDIGGSDECKAALADVVERANDFGFDADAAKSALQKMGGP